MTSRNIVRESIAALTGHVERPDVEAQLFVADTLLSSVEQLLTHPERELTAIETETIHHLIERRISGVPLAYLRGKQDFYGRTFIIEPGVLIPRPATELLITAFLHGPQTIHSVVDVGSGSGCIACTIALERPTVSVTAIDPSPIARRVTAKNIDRFQLAGRVTVQDGDLLRGITSMPDVIMANLPYLHPDQLSEASIAHEPLIALDGGDDGLQLIRALVEQVARLPRRPIGLILECDPRDCEAVQQLVVETLRPQQHSLLGEEAVHYGLAAWWY
jgi:release factor glutamine methyltransferase